MQLPLSFGTALLGFGGGPRPDEFDGKIAVITGGGSGIGRSTAILLSRLGATVHIAEINHATAESVAAEINAAGGRAKAHQVDVSDAAAVERLAEAVYASDKRVDILFNNAGIGLTGPVESVSLEDWQRTINVNVMGVVHGVHYFVPRMLKQGGGGHIVNTASLLGLSIWPEFVPYCTSKHAVVGLTESLNAELSSKGINVTALCPGVVNTPIIHDAVIQGEFEERRKDVVNFMQKFGTSPDKVADAVVDAIRRRQLIRTVPHTHVIPAWTLRRLSPSLGVAFGSRVFGFIKRHN